VSASKGGLFPGGVADYVIGGAIALVLGGLASYIMTLLGSWFIALILGRFWAWGSPNWCGWPPAPRSRYLWLSWGVPGRSLVTGAVDCLGSLWRLVAFGLFLVWR